MNLWIVTTGNSDVQLTNDEDWNSWYRNIKKSIYRLPFKPTRVPDEDGEPYRVPARVLSIAYNQYPDEVKPNLAFPLLKNFSDKLKEKNVSIDQIIVLVSDQTDIFLEEVREAERCPYWQDTCELYPILEDYLKEQFPQAVIQPLPLKPDLSQKGLDDWNSVLGLVGRAFKDLPFTTEPETVFVSHQAGTPAISSAVQFCSLAKFSDRIQFLVSNEQKSDLTDVIKSSAYLSGIEIQQAKKLLKRYDYSGIKEVLQRQINEANQPKDEPKLEDEILKHISYLLDVAIQWNFAKFDNFAKDLGNYSNQNLVKLAQAYLEDVKLAQAYLKNAELAKAYLQDSAQYWWWEAYESAYLAVVRLKQGNTVEAMFHSFRAVEGLLKKWLCEKSGRTVQNNEVTLQNGERKKTYGKGLYLILNSIKDINENQHTDIWIFGNFVFECRNDLFHQLKGLQDREAVFAQWKSPDEPSLNEQGWKNRVINCLNFVSDQKFSSIEDASLMAKVHRELEEAIANLLI